MNFRPIPFVRLLIPLIVGIVFQELAQLEMYGWWSGSILLTLFVTIIILANKRIQRKYRSVFGIITNLTMMLIGMGLHYFHQENNKPNHFGNSTNEKTTMIGSVKEIIPKGKNYQVILKISHSFEDNFQSQKGRLLAYIPVDTQSQDITIGDTLLFHSFIKAPPKPQNPKAFDYPKYLHTQNIHYTTYIKQDQWQKTNHKTPFSILELSRKIQNKCLNILHKHLPTARERSVASALILGYKPDLDKETKTAYSDTGAMHVLAVSGLHTGFIYLLILQLLNKIPFRHKFIAPLKTIILIICLWMFALITGAAPSVLRSATMFSFLAIGKAINREASIYNTLAASAFCLLLTDPFLIFSPGFQLSYLAVASIVYFQPLIYQLWFCPWKRINYFWQLISVSFAAQIGTFPLSLYYFHKLPLYFWLSGIIVVPAAGFILPAGLLLFAVDRIPVVGWLVGKVLYFAVFWMNKLIFLIRELPGNLLSESWIDFPTLVVISTSIIALIHIIEKRKARSLIFLGALMVLLSSNKIVRTSNQLNQRNFTVYHNRNISTIEFIDGSNAYTMTASEPENTKLEYMTSNHHLSRAVKTQYFIKPDSSFIQAEYIRCHQGYIQFFDKHFFLLNGQSSLPQKRTKIDYLIVSQNPKTPPGYILNKFDFSTIILDGSMPYFEKKKWLSWCKENQFNYWDTSQQGAFTLNF
jgi:competence protein ComEC